MSVSSPHDARKRQFDGESTGRARLIAIIEDAIEQPRDQHWVDIRTFSARVVGEVLALYQEAGWRVRVDSDPRDGEAMVLVHP